MDISQFNCVTDHQNILNHLYNKWPKDRIIKDKALNTKSGTGAISIRDNLHINQFDNNPVIDAYIAKPGSVESKDSVFDLN